MFAEHHNCRMASVYYGWIVCVHFVILYTFVAGAAASYAEILVSMDEEFTASLTLISMYIQDILCFREEIICNVYDFHMFAI